MERALRDSVEVLTGTPLDWGIAAGVSIIVIKMLFEMLGKTAERSHVLLQQSTLFSREDYLRLQGAVDDLRAEVQDVCIGNTRLVEELKGAARRDVEFYDRQLPALLKRATYRDYRIDCNRDSINDVRAHLKMPLVNQTPPQGVPVVIQDDPRSLVGKKRDDS